MKNISEKKTASIRLTHNFKLEERDMEVPRGKSMTIQNDAYSIQEILEKFSQGLNPGVYREGTFSQEEPDHDDPDHSQILSLDLTEREELLEQTKARVARQKTLLQEMQEEKTEPPKKSTKYKEKEDDLSLRNEDNDDKNESEKIQTDSDKKKGGKKPPDI